MASWKSGLFESAAIAGGAAAGAYVAAYIPGGAWGQLLIGFALVFVGASFLDGIVGDVVMGVGAGIVVMALPSLIVKAKKAAA